MDRRDEFALTMGYSKMGISTGVKARPGTPFRRRPGKSPGEGLSETLHSGLRWNDAVWRLGNFVIVPRSEPVPFTGMIPAQVEKGITPQGFPFAQRRQRGHEYSPAQQSVHLVSLLSGGLQAGIHRKPWMRAWGPPA